MNKKLLLFISLFLIYESAIAQVQLDDYIVSIGDAIGGSNTAFVTMQATETEGTPLLYDEFMTGVIKKNGVETVPVKLNVDLLNDMVIVSDGKRLIGITLDKVDVVQITSPRPITLKNGFNTDGKDKFNKRSLFEVLYEGENYTLLRGSTVNLQKDVATYGTATQKDVYLSKSKLYVISDGNFDGLNTRKRKFYNTFGVKKGMVQKFVKDNNLDIKQDTDLARIFQYADAN